MTREGLTLISVSEFSMTPHAMSGYKSGDIINRSNFLPWLTRSFAVSLGDIEDQYMFMSWVSESQGFDWRTTLQNFIDSGGWENLADEERLLFAGEFSKVAKHSTGGADRRFASNPGVLLNEQLQRLLRGIEYHDSGRRDLSSKYSQFQDQFGIPENEKQFLQALKQFNQTQ